MPRKSSIVSPGPIEVGDRGRVGLPLLATSIAAGGVAFAGLGAPSASAATFTVDSSADGAANQANCTTPVANACRLRDAVAAANSTADFSDKILFSSSLSGSTINLTQGPFASTTGALAVEGPGKNDLTLSGNDASRIFDVATNSGLSISDLTLADGYAFSGGAIRFTGGNDLRLEDVRVSSSSAADFGGGIYAFGAGTTVGIEDTEFIENASGNGGGLYVNLGASAMVTGTTFADNISDGSGGGGAIAGFGMHLLSVNNSTFSGNVTTGYAGGAINFHGDHLEIGSSTFTDNEAPIYGGAIAYSPATPGERMTFTKSIASGNTAAYQPDISSPAGGNVGGADLEFSLVLSTEGIDMNYGADSIIGLDPVARTVAGQRRPDTDDRPRPGQPGDRRGKRRNDGCRPARLAAPLRLRLDPELDGAGRRWGRHGRGRAHRTGLRRHDRQRPRRRGRLSGRPRLRLARRRRRVQRAPGPRSRHLCRRTLRLR